MAEEANPDRNKEKEKGFSQLHQTPGQRPTSS